MILQFSNTLKRFKYNENCANYNVTEIAYLWG